jgi:hypothetical protein
MPRPQGSQESSIAETRVFQHNPPKATARSLDRGRISRFDPKQVTSTSTNATNSGWELAIRNFAFTAKTRASPHWPESPKGLSEPEKV